MPITTYRDLDVWRVSMTFAEEVYVLTRKFPREELYGLTSQLRRAAIGIPSHVSEGHQHGAKAYRHYIVMALGSQAECETQLELAERIQLAPATAIAPVAHTAARVGMLLHGLLRSLPKE